MFRKAFIPSLILFCGLAIAAIVHAQDSGSDTRKSTTLVDQLARIRDELSGRSTDSSGHQHAQSDHIAPTKDNQPQNYEQRVNSPPTPPTGVSSSPTPGVYENPYALSDDYQPAMKAQSSRSILSDQAAAKDTIASPAPRVVPSAPATSEERLSLQERLARLIQGQDPEPRSAVAPGSSSSRNSAIAEPAHNHAEPVETRIPTPTRSPVQTDPLARTVNVDSQDATSLEAEPARRTTPNEVIPSIAGMEKKNDEFLYVEKSPQLTASISGPKSVNIGRTATYSVVLQNLGGDDAGVVNVTLGIPAWAEVTRATGTSGSVQHSASGETDGSLVWRIPAVVGQSRERLELDIVPRESRPLEVAVQVAQAPMLTTTVVDVKEPKLQIVIAGPDEVQFGETKVYQLTVANPGDGTAENVMIELLPLSGQQAAVASHPLGKLSPGESKTIDIELNARQPGTLSVKAQATAEGGLASNIEKSVLVRRAGLHLEVEAPEAQYASTQVKYLIHVSNPGNATARSVKVSATLPPGAEVQSASAGGQAGTSGAVVSWNLDALAAQDDKVLELLCTLNTPGANRLQVVTDAATDLSDAATAATNVIAVADLKLDISDPQGPVAVGREAVYTIHVRNRRYEGRRRGRNLFLLFRRGRTARGQRRAESDRARPGGFRDNRPLGSRRGESSRDQGGGRSRREPQLSHGAALPAARYAADRRRNDAVLRRPAFFQRRADARDAAHRLARTDSGGDSAVAARAPHPYEC